MPGAITPPTLTTHTIMHRRITSLGTLGPRVAYLKQHDTFHDYVLSTIINYSEAAFVRRHAGGDEAGYAAFVQHWRRDHGARWASKGAALVAARGGVDARMLTTQWLLRHGMKDGAAHELAGRKCVSAAKLDGLWAALDEAGVEDATKLRMLQVPLPRYRGASSRCGCACASCSRSAGCRGKQQRAAMPIIFITLSRMCLGPVWPS